MRLVPAGVFADKHKRRPRDMKTSVLASVLTAAFGCRKARVHPSQEDEELGMLETANGIGRTTSATKTKLSISVPPASWESGDSKKSSSSTAPATVSAVTVPVWGSTNTCCARAQPPLLAAGLSSLESKRPSPDFCDCEDLPGKSQVTPQQLENTIKELADNISSFDDKNFSFVRPLQKAPRNKGRVDHMEMFHGSFASAVAVKGMPRSWMRRSHCEFRRSHPESTEQPWVDVGILKELNRRRYSYACKLLGIFESDDRLLVVTSLSEIGDLFSWIVAELSQLGLDREGRIQPVAAQLCDATCWLHELGIAHRDISLENIVLTGDKTTPELKLIDFGVATAARHSTQGSDYGKSPYRAPEMHTHCEYDAFLADAFATGVVILSMVLASYPWQSTRPGGDPKFTQVMLLGISKSLESTRTNLPGGTDATLPQVASSDMRELLVGLLAPQPCRRHTLGESCFATRFSVWNSPWLRELRPNHGF